MLVILVICAPVFAPYDPAATDTQAQLQPPSARHLLGTDLLGRDVLSRTLYGGQRTLLIAGAATFAGLVPGIIIGLSAAGRGWWAVLAGTLINALLALPGLLLAFVLLTVLGRGALALALATGATQVGACARVVQSAARSILHQEYIAAAQLAGARQVHLLNHHVLPNVQPLLLSYAGVIFSYCLLNNAALSFLGFGDPSVPDWGMMLYDARASFRAAPWIGVLPALGMTLLVSAVNRAASRA